MLGLIIGIMSVILVISVGAGAQSLITNQIKKRGTDLIAILAGASDEKGPPASAMGIVITTLTDDDRKSLANTHNVKYSKESTSYISGNDILSWRNNERNVTYTGTNYTYPDLEQIKIANGRFFDQAEETTKAHVAIIGATIAEEIFGNQDPVGEFVKIKKKNFKIIGVLEAQGSSGFENPDNAVLIPLSVAQQELMGVRHVSFIRVRVDDEKHVDQTVEEIKQTLIERHDDEDFSIRTVADILTMLTTITNVLRFFLAAIAGISLFVGGVGIMNIMLISVKEKTKEIGLRKSVGATHKDIMQQFLTETIIISLIAGCIGIIAGAIIAFTIYIIVNQLGYDYAFVISPLSIVASFSIAASIGLIFGIVPAKKASNLDPISALRYE
jgi:ABC-type antimicrobial peptide transport system permease subunit